MDIMENLLAVRRRIAEVAVGAGRDPADIRLLAVSKNMPPAANEEAYRAGQRTFAENRVQEWVGKAGLLPGDCEWHLIGRLQTNKVKYLDRRIRMIHSLDRLELLQTLEEQGAKKDLVWTTLVQVNVAYDSAKAGLAPGEVKDLLAIVANYPHVRVAGLMTIGALDASPEETRSFFRELRRLRDTLVQNALPGVDLKELSMGMSQDYEIAIEEGATIIRLGRQIFGERQ